MTKKDQVRRDSQLFMMQAAQEPFPDPPSELSSPEEIEHWFSISRLFHQTDLNQLVVANIVAACIARASLSVALRNLQAANLSGDPQKQHSARNAVVASQKIVANAMRPLGLTTQHGIGAMVSRGKVSARHQPLPSGEDSLLAEPTAPIDYDSQYRRLRKSPN